jgi:hypothetical protein
VPLTAVPDALVLAMARAEQAAASVPVSTTAPNAEVSLRMLRLPSLSG